LQENITACSNSLISIVNGSTGAEKNYPALERNSLTFMNLPQALEKIFLTLSVYVAVMNLVSG
jgi:hypothetical protein